MAKGSLYSLVFLFNGSEISLDDLRQKAAKAIGRHLSDVDLQLIPIDPQRLQLSIVGSLESVDACHDKINRELFDRHSCVRLHDEAGVEIRQQAYPILARIEQLLRDFINRAMIEVAGFDWWDSMTPPSIRTKVREVEKKSGRIAVIHHPLEFTDFDHLVQIITGSVQEWAEDRPFSVADFLEVLSDCDSMEEVQTKLENKIRRISLWDAVFVRYFERTDQWSELKEDIRKFVIPARNEVMHHRPMRLYELRNLSRIEEGIRALLASAKAELSQEERVEARRISLDFIDVIRRQQEELARTMLEPFRRQQEELARTMLEPIRRQQEELARTMLEPIRRQQEELARTMLEPIRRQQQEWARIMLEPIRRQQEEWARTMLEPVQRQQEELARTMLEPIRRQQQEWARIMLEPIRRQQEEWARIMLEPIQRWQEQMTRTTRQIVELPMSEFREDESEHKDFEPDVNSVDDDA